jgi:7-cyano-7-deazaguanine synthase
MEQKKYAVLALSGGMDSSTLLLHLLANGYEVTALSFDYGQKHSVELECAKDLVNYLNGCSQTTKQDSLGTITVLKENYPVIRHQIIKIDGITQLLNSALVTGGDEVPEGHYAEENMKATVVPNRNKIFSSITQAVALSIATKNNTPCVIALGIHAGDHAIYPDCTETFRQADLNAFRIGNWDSNLVDFYAPYMEGNKFTILEDGLTCCERLGVDFDEVYKRTNTSYKPLFIPSTGQTTDSGFLQGKWYSDFKSASSVERVEAFINLGRPDPVKYAEKLEDSSIVEVPWDLVVKRVQGVLEDYSNKQ